MPVEALVAYASGEASPEVAAHVAACPACQAAASEYMEMQREIGGRLFRLDCPTPHRLGEYELRLLSPEEQTQVAGHVRDCPHCTGELRLLRDYLAQELPAPEPTLSQRLRQVVATLLTVPPPAALAGVRGATEAGSQRYQADDVTITLDLGPAGRRARVPVTGLIWREGAAMESLAGHPVRLITDEGAQQTVTIGPLGDFGWEAIAPGRYRLEVELKDRLIVVEELRIGA
jgi:hypothetical protein